MSNCDPVSDCYQALMGETDADTCCKRIRVLVRRMQRDNKRTPHELHLMTLANQLTAVTKSFSRYIFDLYAHVDDGDYISALQVSEAMIQHETLLIDLAAGRPMRYGASLN